MGDAVNTAARIGAKAKKNRVTVSESVYEKTKDSLSFKKTASKKMKGKKKRVRMFELSSSNAKREQNNVSEWMSESRHLIGNKDLLADFENQIKKALEGESIVFAIEGHAGLGKSRIVRELEKNLEKNKCRVYKGNCLSYGSSLSYHPWIEILNSIFGITSHDAMESRKKKIASMLLRMNKSMKDWLPLIGEIMSVKFEMNDLVRNLDNSLKMQKFYDIVLELLVFISRESFLSIVIEDYHWSDNSSSELLNYICRNTKKERIMFLIPYRPISDKAGIKEIEASVKHKLKELSEEETGELIENLLDVENIDKEMKNLIMKKSQGNPFYVEELVKSFIEQNYIAKEKGGWSLNRKAEEIALPNSVEEVILSRIDRLDLKEREILQSASVLGREFDMNLLSSLCSDKKLLVSSMNVLKQLDLIKTDEENEKKFFFKHILTCETAYNTLSFAKKRETHEKAGRLLEKKEKDRALNLGMLSYHFHKAHNREKALRYSLEAGEKSKVVYANDEAIEFFSRAIENCNESADLMIEKAARCHEERASVYSFIGRGEDAIKDTQESLNLAVESKDKSLLAFCLSEACIVYELSSKFDKMKESAEKALEIYIELSDKFGIAKAYNYIGMYYGIAGEPKREMEILLKAAEILKGAREEYEKTKKKSVSKGEEVSLLAVILNNLGYVQRLLGDNESALKNYEESLKARKLIEDKTGIAQVLNNIGMIYGRGGDIPRAMPYCEESIKIYDEIGNKKGLGSSLINYGYFNGEIGNHQKELECYEKSLQIQKQINDKYVMSFTLGNIGNYHLKMNNPKKALECQLESLALKKEINDRTGMAATYSNIARCYKEKRIENLKEELKIYEEAGEEKKAAELKEKIK